MNASEKYLRRELAITSFVGWVLFLAAPVLIALSLFAWDWRWAAAGTIVALCQGVCARAERELLERLTAREQGTRLQQSADG